jgi:hypothetical protein
MRQSHVHTKYDKEPDWRQRGRALTTGYQPRW